MVQRAKKSLFSKPLFWLGAIVVLGVVLRLIAYGFIKIPWILYDEVVYLDTSRQIVRGSFLSKLTRDQLYPPGWPLIFSALSGFINNPYLQYKVVLLFNIFLSSSTSVIAYLFFRNLWVSAFLNIYPALFVYSSSIMSETAYIFFLFLLVLILREIVRDDLNSPKTVILAGLVFAFFMYYTRLIRSFGIILLPSFVVAILVFCYLTRHELSKKLHKSLQLFLILTVGSYMVYNLLGKDMFLASGMLYETKPYWQALIKNLGNVNLMSVLVKNELLAILISGFWFLPLFFVKGTIQVFKKKEWADALSRLFIILLLFASLALTLVHMLKGAPNKQYLLFTRYLDPVLVVVFAFSLYDFFDYLIHTHKPRLSKRFYLLYFILLGAALIYLRKGFYLDSYKFGNNMPLYFLNRLVQDGWTWFYVLSATLSIIAYLLWSRRYKLLLAVFVVFMLGQSFVAIEKTRGVPRYVIDNYSQKIKEWQLSFKDSPTDTPLCLYDDNISVEVYYMYHFLYPRNYLYNCNSYTTAKPKKIITSKYFQGELPSECSLQFKFDSGESIYYCPLGY